MQSGLTGGPTLTFQKRKTKVPRSGNSQSVWPGRWGESSQASYVGALWKLRKERERFHLAPPKWGPALPTLHSSVRAQNDVVQAMASPLHQHTWVSFFLTKTVLCIISVPELLCRVFVVSGFWIFQFLLFLSFQDDEMFSVWISLISFSSEMVLCSCIRF